MRKKSNKDNLDFDQWRAQSFAKPLNRNQEVYELGGGGCNTDRGVISGHGVDTPYYVSNHLHKLHIQKFKKCPLINFFTSPLNLRGRKGEFNPLILQGGWFNPFNTPMFKILIK